MLRGDGQDGRGFSYGGDSQQSPRRWENQCPVWRSCYEYAVVTSVLKRVEATESDPDQGEAIEELWRKRAELAERIVTTAAPTIQDLLLKAAVAAFLLSEGEVGVVLSLQFLEECDLALAQEGYAEQCLKALEPELWALCQRVEDQKAELDARWHSIDQNEGAGSNEAGDRRLLTTAWDDLNEAVWHVARYETMTAVGLKAKGKLFRGLTVFVSTMDGVRALQDSYLRDFDHLAYRRLRGKDSPIPRRCID